MIYFTQKEIATVISNLAEECEYLTLNFDTEKENVEFYLGGICGKIQLLKKLLTENLDKDED